MAKTKTGAVSKADDDTLTTVLSIQGTPAYARALARAMAKDGHTNISQWVDSILAAHVLTRQGVKLPPRAGPRGRPPKNLKKQGEKNKEKSC